jgi:hypothetical protein
VASDATTALAPSVQSQSERLIPKQRLTDETIERLARKLLPPGGRAVSVRLDDGPPQRGLLYRTDEPFAPIVRELRTLQGERLRLQVSCVNDGYVLVTWGKIQGEAK